MGWIWKSLCIGADGDRSLSLKLYTNGYNFRLRIRTFGRLGQKKYENIIKYFPRLWSKIGKLSQLDICYKLSC